LIHAIALEKHHVRTVREYPMAACMIGIAGIVMSIAGQSIWPFAWAVGIIVLTKLDMIQMDRTKNALTPAQQKTQERFLMVSGLFLTTLFLSLPLYLILTMRHESAIAGIALMAAAATRSASMFAVSKKVGLAYAFAYFVLPGAAFGIDTYLNPSHGGTGHFVSWIAITCALLYIWRAWLTRHKSEVLLDQVLAETELRRDDATRDAAVSRLLFQHTSLRAALFDDKGCFIAVNPSWLNAISKTEADILGKPFCEAMPDFESHWRVAIEKALKGEATRKSGDARTRYDNTQVYLDWEVQPWYALDGSIGGAVAYAQDVTDIHKARAAATTKQERLELALKASKAFIWEVDYVAQTVTYDEDAVEFYGHAPTFEMVSKRENSPIHPDDREPSKQQAKRIAANGGYGRMEARHIQPDGSLRWVRSDLAPKGFTNGVATSFVMMTSDVTEEMSRHERLAAMMARANIALAEKRKLLEELCGETSLSDALPAAPLKIDAALIASDSAESTFTHLFQGFEQILTEIDDRDMALAAAVQQLRDARTSAEAANVAKSQFLANMSHELRTPLNAIIGYTEILIEDAEYEQRLDAAKDAGKVRNSATHLLGLINEILDLSKIEAGKMDVNREPTALSDVLADIITSSTPLAAQNNNKLVVEIDCDRTLALTDGFRLRQCLLNMMSNACKFTQDGNITLRLEITETDENHRWYDISVIDTGIGISPEQQTRLFKPFSQADGSTTRKYGGTGLGLALTREMTQLLGGEVFVESAEGQGAKFTIRIPALGLEAEDVGTIFATETAAPLVLVVDDDPLARALTARSAAALGMSIASAETGRAALAFCDQNKVDLVVLDLQLPDIDGNDVLAALRGSPKTRNIPVMVVSIDDDRRRSISAGAQEHLAKPCPSAVLTAAIARLTRRGVDTSVADTSASPLLTPSSQTHASDVSEKQNKKRSA
jgi:PAS domain S-box-containing protein